MFTRFKASFILSSLCISLVMVVLSGCGSKQHDTSEIVSLQSITLPINATVVDIPDEEIPIAASFNDTLNDIVSNENTLNENTLNDITSIDNDLSLDISANEGKDSVESLAPSVVNANRYYQFSSSYTDLYIEEFALQVKTDILTANWEDLSRLVSYPITIKGVEYKSPMEFLANDWDTAFSTEWLGELMEEDCNKMGQNGEGFMMASGAIWVYDLPSGASSELKIVAING